MQWVLKSIVTKVLVSVLPILFTSIVNTPGRGQVFGTPVSDCLTDWRHPVISTRCRPRPSKCSVVLAECQSFRCLWQCSVGLCITNINTWTEPHKPTSPWTNVASKSHWEWERKFLELSFLRAKVPGSENSWNFRSRELLAYSNEHLLDCTVLYFN